jgi:hypothetical protein
VPPLVVGTTSATASTSSPSVTAACITAAAVPPMSGSFPPRMTEDDSATSAMSDIASTAWTG